MTKEDVVKNYVFLTAGACGPCRFGMYVTEYRKALRDAGFDGFRVMLFQQTGRPRRPPATRSASRWTRPSSSAIVKAIVCGDVLNALGYRIRPYEVEPAPPIRALEQSKQLIYRGARVERLERRQGAVPRRARRWAR
jgi:predicted nucleotide-binding protein (sugar kinase/HSP70/actin superfamily)